MENIHYDFEESIATNFFDVQQSVFNTSNSHGSTLGGDDEDGDDEDSSDENDPPLDESVNTAPVPVDPGGKPKT